MNLVMLSKGQLSAEENEKNVELLVVQFRMHIVKNSILLSRRNLSDWTLRKFLRAKNYDVGKAFDTLKAYVEFMCCNPNLLRPTAAIKIVMDSGFFDVAAKEDSKKVLIIRPGKWDTSLFQYQDIETAGIWCFETLALDEELQKNGLDYVIDMRGYSWWHLASFGPHARRSSEVEQKAMPIRINRIHMFNESRLTRMAFSVVKPFLSLEQKDRIKLHGNSLASLHNFVCKDSLPEDLGGNCIKLQHSVYNWFNRLQESEATIRELWAALVNEN